MWPCWRWQDLRASRLARYITRPIEKLRLAASALANEQLETRVDPEVVARGDALGELGRDFDRMAERINALVTAERRLLARSSPTRFARLWLA